MDLIAYEINQPAEMGLAAAPRSRLWMQATPEHFAERCLPLLIANQSGWLLVNNVNFQAMWDGSKALNAVHIYSEQPVDHIAKSFFGSGILTFQIPYLFRTPPGWNLLVRGPANAPKDSIYPLEGVVETDWCQATFTMNWKFTRSEQIVSFIRGEPIAMIVPEPRGVLEEFQPRVVKLAESPEDAKAFREWSESRNQFNAGLQSFDPVVVQQKWQKDYFQGRGVPGHQTKLQLKEFDDGN